MVLEAVMVVVDNSESSRNGDYPPTRFEAQADAINILFQSIVQGNPESSVGLMSMGGKGPEVLATLTTEAGQILEGLHRTKKQIKGTANLSTGIQIAWLALKHRQNKSQRARIVVFVCSPIEDDSKKLIQLAKKMKKNNVYIDFVLFGELEDDETQQKLQAFNDIVKVNDGCHMVVIPPSSKLLSDQLIATPILLGTSAAAASGGAGVEGFEEFGFDPAMDPELALALRMSMEEEKSRLEKLAREQQEAEKAKLEKVDEKEEEMPLLDISGSSKDADKGNDKGGDKPGDGDKMDTS